MTTNLRIFFSIIIILIALSCDSYSQDNEVVVYITMYGECYHSENCSYINRKSEITLLKAINKGYRKCSHCHGTSSEKMWVEGVEEQKEKNNYILSFTISFIIIWGIAASIIINYIISVRKQEKSLP